MRPQFAIGAAAAAAALLSVFVTRSLVQTPTVHSVDETVLREYVGAYRWDTGAYLYLQRWNEFTGTNELLALDESGDVRVLYAADTDRFFTGRSAAVPDPVESRLEFQRSPAATVVSVTWQRNGGAPRIAHRVDIERSEDVRFSNGNVQLSGTLISPRSSARPPAMILVHGSGPASRDQVLPLVRFVIRHGIAVLAYDKRGVGTSTGDWNTASFDDLAGDVVAAYEYLKTRTDIDPKQVGVFGWSQAGWIMPLAAVRAKDMAFLISVSGAGVAAAETTIDQAQNEMTARGMKPQTVADIVSIMKLQYAFARTGQGWADYAAAREKLSARIGPPPDTLPGTTEHPYWQFIRRLYFHDPEPVLRQLQTPTLALFGELDNNILAAKNQAAWERALKAAGNRDYTLRILPKANHLQLEAKVGSSAEMASLQRFVPEYSATVLEWLAARIQGVRRDPSIQ